MSRTTPPPSLPRPAIHRPPRARRAPTALVLALALTAAGAFTTHAPAATAAGQAKGSDPGQAGTGQAESAKAGEAKPYLQMRQSARERNRARAQARRSARTGETLSTDERVAKIVENAWWNEPDLAGRLHLTDALRQKMDELLRDNLAGRREALETSRGAQKAFYEALEAGDPKAAAGHLDAVDQAQTAIVRSQLKLRLAVAKLLTPDQRKSLAATRPRLWRERWVRLEPRANTARRGQGGATTDDGSGS